jgi:hypothetical protein
MAGRSLIAACIVRVARHADFARAASRTVLSGAGDDAVAQPTAARLRDAVAGTLAGNAALASSAALTAIVVADSGRTEVLVGAAPVAVRRIAVGLPVHAGALAEVARGTGLARLAAEAARVQRVRHDARPVGRAATLGAGRRVARRRGDAPVGWWRSGVRPGRVEHVEPGVRSGRVEHIEPGVQGSRVGSRVGPVPCIARRVASCGGVPASSLEEQKVASAAASTDRQEERQPRPDPSQRQTPASHAKPYPAQLAHTDPPAPHSRY